MKVYLAGKIGGLAPLQMREWRNRARALFNHHGYTVLDPCDTDLCEIAEESLIVESNIHMIKQADVVLMELAWPNVSFGTACELGVCAAIHKPVVAFSQLVQRF